MASLDRLIRVGNHLRSMREGLIGVIEMGDGKVGIEYSVIVFNGRKWAKITRINGKMSKLNKMNMEEEHT